ncbi:hypothetical protein EV421DRAFT_1737961 [Armillaria borealis]|uniref:Uncharacterized protein n=1 Tax=Armillaria borealis TaxID=47425 RepID=A0AA39MMP9_9AGAR|nr:hypothetical protein EV421DRAFT_1737961 [Armillaria borealis]
MSGSIFSVITRTPLTEWDASSAPPDTSVTDSYDGAAPKRVKASTDVLIDTQQSEVLVSELALCAYCPTYREQIEKYLAHLSQVEGYKTTDTHQGVGSTTATLSLAETVTGFSYAEAADIVERPSFYADFNVYTMDSPFLRMVYMAYGEPDYEALYEVLLKRQATGCAILRKGLWENGAAVFADVRDPGSCRPIPLRLTLVAEIDITYTEEELDFFVDRKDHLRTNVPGIFANLELGNEPHCSSEGRFLMNRCWAKTQPDGSMAELFEGYVEFKVDSEMYFLGRHGEDINLVQHAFWAIRDLPMDEVDFDGLNGAEGTFDYSFLL